MSKIRRLTVKRYIGLTRSESKFIREVEAAMEILRTKAAKDGVEIDWNTLQVNTEEEHVEHTSFAEETQIVSSAYLYVEVEGCKHDCN